MAKLPESTVLGRIEVTDPGFVIEEHAKPGEPGWLVVIEYQDERSPGRTACRGYRYAPAALVLETRAGTEIYPVPGNLRSAHFFRDRDSGR